MYIDWVVRDKGLRRILNHYKEISGDNYDCMVAISGGKDSTYQLHLVTQVYRMKPLAVTFNYNWMSETGKYNLQNVLERLNVDHIMFTPNRSLVNRLAKRSLELNGDSCWHCHAGVDSFPLQAAVMYKIPLIIFGESVAEGHSGKATYYEPCPFDLDYIQKVSTKSKIEEVVNEEITLKDLWPFKIPTLEELEKHKIVRLFLGDYMFWDSERQVELIKDLYDWRKDDVDGTYKKYKSIECRM